MRQVKFCIRMELETVRTLPCHRPPKSAHSPEEPREIGILFRLKISCNILLFFTTNQVEGRLDYWFERSAHCSILERRALNQRSPSQTIFVDKTVWERYVLFISFEKAAFRYFIKNAQYKVTI